jgi:hypothetical protein
MRFTKIMAAALLAASSGCSLYSWRPEVPEGADVQQVIEAYADLSCGRRQIIKKTGRLRSVNARFYQHNVYSTTGSPETTLQDFKIYSE